MAPLQPKPGHFGLILPLCTSSATVGLALFQYPVFYSFLQSSEKNAGRPLSRYWEPYMKLGYPVIIACGLTSAVSGALSWRWLSGHGQLETTEVAKWYGYGAILAFARFAFLPIVAGPIKKMVDAGKAEVTTSDDDVDKANREAMQTWMILHSARTFLFDLPALWCFGEGAALSFWVI